MSAEKVLQAMLDERNKPLRERYPQYEIGEGSYGGLRVMGWDDKTQLRVGKFCSFSYDVQVLLGGEHRVDWATTYPFSSLPEWPEAAGIEGHPATRGDVIIGNDVWVGAGVMLLSGTELGDGCVVAARSVVTGLIAPYSIVGGNPCRFLKWRFPEPVRAALVAMRWWDWPRDKLAAALPLMLSRDVEKFIREGQL